MNYSTMNMDHVWAFDLETASNDTAAKFHAKFAKDIKAPSNWKDEEKIKAYKEKALAELREKDALTWLTGKVCSIAITNVGDVMKNINDIPKALKSGKIRHFAFCGFDEKKLLLAAHNVISDGENAMFQLVGKNNSAFDNGFLIGRMMVNDVPIPAMMKNSYNLMDIDMMIGGTRASNQIASLSKYCFALGMDDKLLAGNMVPRLYKDAVAAKVAGDVEKVKEIMLKIKAYNIDDTVKTAIIAGKLLAI